MSARRPETTPADPAKPVEDAFSARVGVARFQLWFPPNARFVWLGHELVVAARNAHFAEWAAEKFGVALAAAAADVAGTAVPVRYVADPDLFAESAAVVLVPPASAATGKKPAPAAAKPPQKNLFGEEPLVIPPAPSRKREAVKPGRRWRSFAEFVPGICNRVAHAAALSVVDEPGMGANPVVIHGPVGTGKTHLLEAIYAGVRKKYSDVRPVYVTAEDFTHRFVQGTRHGKMTGFRREFRDCGVLLFDDLNFLASKKATQEEFLHTLDALTADGRQVVITTDCHPRLAEDLLPELADRLLGGAVWGVMPPDDETRLGILRAKAAGASPGIPDDVLKFLARSLKGNVRELEGAVNTVRHFAKVTGQPCTPAVAREALGDLLRHTVRAVTLADVDAAVCAALRIAAGTLQSKSRSWAVSHPRMLAIFLSRKLTAATYGEIAKHFGVKQHSTAVAGEKKVRQWVAAKETLSLGDRKWAVKDLLDRVERDLQK